MKKLDIIDHIALQVKDIDKSIEYYTTHFKCEVLYQDDSWGFLKFKNTKLAFVKKEQHPFHFAIIKESFESKEGLVEHRDGSVSKYVKDIDGNSIELLKYKD